MIPDIPVQLTLNARGARGPAPDNVRRAIADGGAARAEISTWAACAPTPLHRPDALAHALGIGTLLVKDESGRCGLGAFKSIGGAYAVYRVVADRVFEATGHRLTSRELMSGRFREITREITVACASAGNHGRAVAWGARLFGCACTVYLDEGVSRERADNIAALGAVVRRTRGGYDRAVEQIAADAAAHGWTVVSDTAYPGYTEIPTYIMSGYTLIVDEIGELLNEITHIFVQAGVGGLAGAVCAEVWQRTGAKRPRFILVEPEGAACFAASIERGAPAVVPNPHSIMGGLNCGVVSTVAWDVLETGADAVVTIPDAAVGPVLSLLAGPLQHDPRIAAGESGCAGIAAIIGAARDAAVRRRLELDEHSRVLAIVTEGPNDAAAFESLTGGRILD